MNDKEKPFEPSGRKEMPDVKQGIKLGEPPRPDTSAPKPPAPDTPDNNKEGS